MTVFSIALLALAAADLSALRSEWNLRDHIPLDQVVVQSHRGAGVLSPENSLQAFDIAWKLGTVPEADLRASRDGVIVAFHDENFERILPAAPPEVRRRGVADLTWAELQKLDIGAWKGPEHAGQRIARMVDVYEILKAHPERKFYVDIKNVDLKQLARESHTVHKQLILASTKYDIIRQWKRLAPTSATLHWMGGTEAELAARIAELRKTRFADITQLQIHVRTAKDGSLTPSPAFLLKTGEELREQGVVFQALAWDRSDVQIHWQLMDLGVASFATDYPDKVMQAIRDYYQRAAERRQVGAVEETAQP
jgi:glycerophosphoryl diester phosphodiesterase